MLKPYLLRASAMAAFGVGFGNSSTVYYKKCDALAIYVEPDHVAMRWSALVTDDPAQRTTKSFAKVVAEWEADSRPYLT
jgi:hypothetical protein